MIDSVPPPADPSYRTFSGRDFTVVMASDVLHRDGMGLELHDASTNEIAAEVFYSDASGDMTAWTAQAGVPADALEYLIAEARKRLPPAG